jgi:hypothetical protein
MNIGSLVVCINGSFHEKTLQLCDRVPKKDNNYIIRDILKFNNGKIGVLLDEIVNSPISINGTIIEPSFDIERFRELDIPLSISEEIEELMCEPVLLD